MNNTDTIPVVGDESAWIKGGGRTGVWWNDCPQDTIVTSRCASGESRDCKLPECVHHGIKCRHLHPRFFLKPLKRYDCGRFGEQISCPDGYFMTGACGAGRAADCSILQCSGENSWSAITCQKYAYLDTIEWDYSKDPYYEIEILNDYNPIVGIISDLDVSFRSEARATATASADFKLEFSGQVDIEANLLSLFGFPSLTGIFNNNEFVELGFETTTSGSATFAAAAEAVLEARAQGQLFSYAVSLCDAWSENFVRLVHYQRKRV